ncbi:MAG: adenosyl-hopene transferase HpnH [Alphaproteobacteria bacterium]|nr:adenosyl-hopene transferase HpnH [Alphaproteobacteria bacterium]
MAVPLSQAARVGFHLLRRRLAGDRFIPLVLMLEPLLRCNLACAGCGKIDWPDDILDRRLGVEACLAAAEECGAPVVSIAGGEPLLHKEIAAIAAGLVARKRYVYLCTNGLLLEKRLDQFRPSPFLTFSVHLDGDRGMHDRSVCRVGVWDRAVAAVAAARRAGFRVTLNCTVFDGADEARLAAFLDQACGPMGVESVTVSPGFAYERAPDQDHFLGRKTTVAFFRRLFQLGKGRRWRFNHSPLYLDFLAGNRDYRCTPWGNPTRTVFGWQRPCYLLGEGYAPSYAALLAETDWSAYGHDRNPKCANCMAHCGFEATAVEDAMRHPLTALKVAMRGEWR